MSGPRIYAAGPIAGQSYKGATDWYDVLRAGIPEAEIIVPMRGKGWAKRIKKFKARDYKEDFRLNDLNAAVSSDNGIFSRDMWDVKRADLVFANLTGADEAEKVSIGTVCEIIAAQLFGNLSVVVAKKHGMHDHPFIRQAAWVYVYDFDDGIAAARIALNLPEEVE
ncbi:hypothetical protein LCGC14_1168650 [marine sediment metagenome]|uniref:Nucleoside 2-deoxyribosyltransferase n=1 Tax=marine sediment metagenome TaxID=412755 RepID=A0A0F9P8N1_9ZZZZ